MDYLPSESDPPAPTHVPAIPAPVQPSYYDMITEAIGVLKEEKGSSRQAIARYIESEYPEVLPPNHASLLTAHLKRLKISGHLLMYKHSYLLPGSVIPASPTMPTPASTASGSKKRGRPAKFKVEVVSPNGGFESLAPHQLNFEAPQQANVEVIAEFTQPSEEFQPDVEVSPPVTIHPNGGLDESQTQSVFVSLGLDDEPQETPAKRSRGRPPKGHLKSGKKGRGRPPKPKELPILDNVTVTIPVDAPLSDPVGVPVSDPVGDPVNAPVNDPVSVPVSDYAVKRGRGRPRLSEARSTPIVRKEGSVGVAKGRGRPKRLGKPPNKLGMGGALEIGISGLLPVKGRGRPRKLGRSVGRPRKNLDAGVDGVTYVPIESIDAVEGVVPAKRQGRGRLPKSGGVKKPRRPSGKPIGRPRKDTSETTIKASLMQQLVAYQELKSKLELIQSRTKQAVSVVKPYFNYDNAPVDAVRALQDLEELATINAIAHPLNVHQGAPAPAPAPQEQPAQPTI